MTLKALAAACGVSVGTVSKAFADSPEISEETKRKIFAFAKEHGVYDKYIKRRYEKKIVGVLCPEADSQLYSRELRLLCQFLRKRGAVMTVMFTDFDEERQKEAYIIESSYLNVDGIIVIDNASSLENLLDVPTVSLGGTAILPGVETIRTDLSVSVRDAVRYYKERGILEMGFAGEKLTQRKNGYFLKALRAEGLPVRTEWLHVSEKRFEEAGIEAVEAMLAAGPLPKAILAAYDNIAIGVIKALRAHGYGVPEDVAVIGMDDIAILPYLDTPLASISGHSEKACELAADLIVKKIEDRFYHETAPLTVDSEFIVRDSAKKAD